MKRLACIAALAVTLMAGAAHAQAVAPVRIGASVSLTGAFSREGRLLKNGYDYWKSLVDSQGGITFGGQKHPVEIVYYDDESKPQTSARLTEKMITEDKVNFILGPYSSGIATATAAISEKYKVITMTPMATADSLYARGYRYIFCPAPLASRALDPILTMAAGLPNPIHTVAIVGPDDLFPNVFAGAAEKKAVSLGLKVVYNTKYTKGTVDLLSVVTALKEANPDALLLTGYVQDFITLMKDMQTLKVNPKLIGSAITVGLPDVLKSLGSAAEDLTEVQIWDPELKYAGPVIPDSTTYVAGYQKQFGEKPNAIVASGTAGALVLQLAIEKAGSLDPGAVRAAMLGLDVETFFGPIKFDDHGVDEKASAAVVQIQNGMPVPVYPAKAAVASLQYPRRPFQ